MQTNIWIRDQIAGRMRILRAFLFIIWFTCCGLATVLLQLVVTPLYLMSSHHYDECIAWTKACFGCTLIAITQRAFSCPVQLSGDRTMKGQLYLKAGKFRTRFPARILIISNHQTSVDPFHMWWYAYANQMHGRIFIVLKESFKYVPFLGIAMKFYRFVLMARRWAVDKPRLEHRLKAIRNSQSPAWLLIFPEGTVFTPTSKQRSNEYGAKSGIRPLKHVILPRSTGLFFCLRQLQGSVIWLYDCTIAYEGRP